MRTVFDAALRHELLKAAYRSLGGKPDEKASDLVATAVQLYWRWRDGVILAWGQAVYEKHGLKLLPFADALLDRIYAVDEGYGDGMMSSDCWAAAEDIAFALANAVAVLRWYNNVRAGRVAESLSLTEDEAQAWLAQYAVASLPKQPQQMSLFLDVT
ncbi:MAG: hypothetical protein IAE79_05815 [Anaerolinea sp.]|nr:hypothetical protein [Anaerolinea sp.]